MYTKKNSKQGGQNAKWTHLLNQSILPTLLKGGRMNQSKRNKLSKKTGIKTIKLFTTF